MDVYVKGALPRREVDLKDIARRRTARCMHQDFGWTQKSCCFAEAATSIIRRTDVCQY
jgi:hypothetical protein